MTLQHEHRATAPPVDATTNGAPRVHVGPPVVDNKPPTRSKVTAGLAALACAACCALPFLIAAGLLTGAGAAIAEKGLLSTSALLIAAAGTMWYLKRRSDARKAAAVGQGGCASGNCSC